MQYIGNRREKLEGTGKDQVKAINNIRAKAEVRII